MTLLRSLADQALQAIEDHYETTPTATPLPDRRLVSIGQAPWDCELLNVWVQRDYPTEGGPELEVLQSIGAHAGNFFRAAALGVQLVRCYPVSPDGIEPPALVEEEEAVAVVYDDVDQIWTALAAANLRGDFSQRNGIAYLGWTVLGPEGGLGGGILTVHALLPAP